MTEIESERRRWSPQSFSRDTVTAVVWFTGGEETEWHSEKGRETKLYYTGWPRSVRYSKL